MPTRTLTHSGPVAILGRVLARDGTGPPPDAARFLLTLEFGPDDLARMNTLAAKARAGRLTSEEDDELESYLTAGDILNMIHSRARKSLKDAGPWTP